MNKSHLFHLCHHQSISINLNKLDFSTLLTTRVTSWWATEAPSPLVAICLTSRWFLSILSLLFKYFDQVEESDKDNADTTDHNNDDDDSSADYKEEGPRKLNRAR